MLVEIYWIHGKREEEILSEKFYEELENEIDFWTEFNFSNEIHYLDQIRTNIINYSKNENQQYINNISSQINTWNDRMKLVYYSPYSVRATKEYIEKGLILFNSNIYRRLIQQQADYVLNNQDIVIYFEIVLSEKFQSSNIREYQNLINEQYQNLETLKEELQETSEGIFKKNSENVEKFKERYEQIVVENQEELDTQYKNYEDKLEEHDKKVVVLQDKYQEKLKIDGPVKFWEEKAKEYQGISKKWLMATIIVIGVLLVSVFLLSCLVFDISYVSEVITITFKGLGKKITIGNIIIIAAIESIIIYAVKVSLKYYDYNLKLYEFYKSKAMLASFIVEIKDEENVDNELIKEVYKEIFKMREIQGEEIPTSGLFSSITKK